MTSRTVPLSAEAVLRRAELRARVLAVSCNRCAWFRTTPAFARGCRNDYAACKAGQPPGVARRFEGRK